jgi:hypothetical protein
MGDLASPGAQGWATPDTAKPQAKEGGVLAGIAMIVREMGDIIYASGGVLVVIIGVSAVATITTASLGSVAEGERATVAAGAFAVLGTIIGAYFGVRVGTRAKEEADQARQIATSKVERLAAEVSPEKARDILDSVDEAAAVASRAKPGGR